MRARYDSYCGLYCGACGTLVATENGSAGRGAPCLGCKSDLLAPGCLEKCLIRPCAMRKGLDSCGDCPEFPCSILVAFQRDGVAHHGVVLENLKQLKQLGKEAWLDAQRARWSCTRCGERFSWKQETCKACGEGLFNCYKEAENLAK